MHKITLEQETYTCANDENVLDLLLRKNVTIAHGCRQGVCQSCLLRSVEVPPSEAQKGLKNTMKALNYFLACQCHPEQDMSISFPTETNFSTEATVLTKEPLNRDIICLQLKFDNPIDFRAGQFVNLKKPDGLTRSYSIANIPNSDNILELHIRRLSGGRFSEWVHNELQEGDLIPVSDPRGLCFYTPERRDQGLLLVGTGSGLAPLAGILNDALAQNHSGPIHLFHGSNEVENLYWSDKLQQIAAENENVHYTACVSGEKVPDGYVSGRANEVALKTLSDLKSWRVFLCGHPDMVNSMKTQAFLNGASPGDIYADAFFIEQVS
jgi:NAD(P)H-flavin reductase/ferredoxin